MTATDKGETQKKARVRRSNRQGLQFLREVLAPDPVEEKLKDVPFEFLADWLAPRSLQTVANHAHAVQIVKKEFPEEVDALLAEWAEAQAKAASEANEGAASELDGGVKAVESAAAETAEVPGEAIAGVPTSSPSSPGLGGSTVDEVAASAETAVEAARSEEQAEDTSGAQPLHEEPVAQGAAAMKEPGVEHVGRASEKAAGREAQLYGGRSEPSVARAGSVVTISSAGPVEAEHVAGALEVLEPPKRGFSFAPERIEIREFDVKKYPEELALMLRTFLRMCEKDKQVLANPRTPGWVRRAYTLPEEKIKRLEELGEDRRFYRIKATRVLRLAIYLTLYCLEKGLPLYRPPEAMDEDLALFGGSLASLIRGDHSGQEQAGTHLPRWVGDLVTETASRLGVYPADLVEVGVDMVISMADKMPELASELRRRGISLRD